MKEESDNELYEDKLKKLIDKYENIKKKDEPKKNEINYDYVKKIKGDFYQTDIQEPTKENKIISNNNNNNSDDDEYDKLFHPKKYKRNEQIINNNKLDMSDYSNSFYNFVINLDKKVNKNNLEEKNLNLKNNKRVVKRKISRFSKYTLLTEENKPNSLVIAPMKGISVTNISFRARMKYFSDKSEKNLEKMIKEKKEEEKQIYTFQPKTSNNSLNVIKFNNNKDKQNENNYKKKVDYNRINNLYMDYKDKQNKLDELTKDYYKKAGISFHPSINDKNIEIKEFKNKIGQIPYMDRIDIFNACKKPNKTQRNANFYHI